MGDNREVKFRLLYNAGAHPLYLGVPALWLMIAWLQCSPLDIMGLYIAIGQLKLAGGKGGYNQVLCVAWAACLGPTGALLVRFICKYSRMIHRVYGNTSIFNIQ